MLRSLVFLSEPLSALTPGTRVKVLAIVLLGAVLVKSMLVYATTYLSTRVAAQTTLDLRSQVVDVVLGGHPGVLSRLGHGRMLNVLSEESWKTGDAVAGSLQFVVALFQFLVYAAILVLISWQQTLVVLSILGLIAVVVRLLTQRIRTISARVTRSNVSVSRTIVDMIGGADVIRGFGTEEQEQRKFESASGRLADDTLRARALTGTISPLYEVLAASIIVGLLLATARVGADIASQLVFVFVLFRLTPVVRRIEHERAELLSAEGAIRETLSVIETAPHAMLQTGTRRFEGVRDCIALSNVSFRYASDAGLALDDLSAELPATGLTAIVGPSGAGKSTLGRLLLRFADPTSGHILVDGVPLTQFELSSWRRRVAVVPQKSFLFNDTVRVNIAYGTRNASDDEVTEAAKAAGAHDFIEALVDGYRTRLGADGVEVSGGEAQRICLARAIIRKPRLLLLDEPTNALVSLSERRIRQALEALKRRCSVVLIAHRLESVRDADHIIVLDQGRLIEQGSSEALLAADGLFSAMVLAGESHLV
jgi:subfamily B ATP-binding cassette protein MsbA